jgi:S1-C subfamily serine protease
MDTLKTVSNEMAALVETVGAGIVRVAARRRTPATGVVMTEDGMIVTANHIIRREEDIRVGLPNGDDVSANLVGRDPSTGLAIIKADVTGLTVPNWVTSEAAKVGHLVLALGRPGESVQATLGVVSALGDSFQIEGGGRIDRYFQTDVVMYPGFSGGPLVSAGGAVYGINNSSLMRGTSITIPTETVQRVGEALMKDGHIKRGYLGVTAQTVRLPEATAQQADQETGLLVASVEPSSPAGAGGVLLGDVIVAMGGNPARSMEDLLSMLVGDVVGQQIDLTVVRGGAMATIPVTIGERE